MQALKQAWLKLIGRPSEPELPPCVGMSELHQIKAEAYAKSLAKIDPLREALDKSVLNDY